MICVSILDQGKTLSPRDLTTSAQLRNVVEQARNMIAECERLLKPKAAEGAEVKEKSAPYMS